MRTASTINAIEREAPVRRAIAWMLYLVLGATAAGCDRTDAAWTSVPELAQDTWIQDAGRHGEDLWLLLRERGDQRRVLARLQQASPRLTDRIELPTDAAFLENGKLLAIGPGEAGLVPLSPEPGGPLPEQSHRRARVQEAVLLADGVVLALGEFPQGDQLIAGAILVTNDLRPIENVDLPPHSYSLQTDHGGGAWVLPGSSSDPLFRVLNGKFEPVDSESTVSPECRGILGVLPSGEVVCRGDFWESDAVLAGDRPIALPRTLKTGMSVLLLGETLVYCAQRDIVSIDLQTGTSSVLRTPGKPKLLPLTGDPAAAVATTDRGYIAIIRVGEGNAVVEAP